MPIFFQKELSEHTKLGIWKIEEDDFFFLQKVMPQRNVTHEHKKLQHLAGRFLLQHLFPLFPVELIRIADTRKPFLENEAYHFSISHCGDYAAAIVSTNNRVGIDIEVPRTTVEKIKNKFLSEAEINMLKSRCEQNHQQTNNVESEIKDYSRQELINYLTVLWSCKEAVFKWYGLGEVDFKKHIVLQQQKQISVSEIETEICFLKNLSQNLKLSSSFFQSSGFQTENMQSLNDLVLSYVVT